MAMPTIIASNQTAGAILFTRLGLTVPASGTLTLTDFATVNEIREDESIRQSIDDGDMLLNYGDDGNLSQGESLLFFNIVTQEVRISVRALADANVGSLSGTTTIDTVVLAVNDRVLLTAQTTGAENGIWVVKAGAWVRPDDFQPDQSAAATQIAIQEGGLYSNQVWNCTNNTGGDIIDTSSLAFAQISGGGGGGHSLQAAYDGGNTIVTAGGTDIAFTLTSGDFTVDDGTVALGSGTALTAFTVDTGTMSLDSTDTTNLTMTANDAGTKTLTLAATNAGAGVSDISISSDGTTTIDADGGVDINSTGGAINVGNDADTGAINVGTGASVRPITIGNATGATSVTVDSGTGGTDINSTGPVTIDAVGASNFTTDGGDLTLSTTTSGGIIANSVGIVDVDAGAAVTIDSSGGTIGIGTDDDDFAINVGTDGERVITIGNNNGTTGVAIETGTGNLLIDSPVTTMTGNLTVQGTTTTVESEIVNIADQYLYLNDGYDVAGSPTDGGIVINTNPQAAAATVAVGGFTAGVAAVSNASVAIAEFNTSIAVASNGASLPQGTINVASTAGFPAAGTIYVTTSLGVQTVAYTGTTGTTFTGATGGLGVMSTGGTVSDQANAIVTGDFVQVKGANDQTNDGLYEVLSNANGLLEIAGIGVTGTTFNFTQNDFTDDATVAGTIRKTEVGVFRSSPAGEPEYGYDGSSTSFVFESITTGATTLSLQTAYDGGNTITTAGGLPVLIAGTQALQVTATGGINLDTVFDADVTTFDVQMTGSNGFSIDGTAASNITVDAGLLTLATTTSGSVEVDGVDGVALNSSAGPINVGNDANTGAINVGTGAAARAITLGNTTGATGVTINSGTEKVEIDGITYYGSNAGLPTATGSGFQDGDKFYDTTLDMEMRYDATRGKWLSIEAAYFQFGRSNNTPDNVYYRGPDGQVMSSTIGFIAERPGTVVGLGYTRADTDAATFEATAAGVAVAELASVAAKGKSNVLNGNFVEDAVLGVRNKTGSNTTSDVNGWLKVRWRSV